MGYEIGFYLLSTIFLLYWIYNPSEKVAKRLGLTFLGLGFITFTVESLFQIIGFGQVGRETTLSVFQILANTTVAVFYFVLVRFRKLNVVRFAPVVSSLALFFSLLGLKLGVFGSDAGGLPVLHVFTSVLAFTLLTLSAVASLFRLFAERQLKRGSLKLPLGLPLNLWVTLERKFFFFGFVFLTLNLVLSFLWLQITTGSVRCDSRICATVALWFYYLLLFHLERFGIEPFKSRFYLFNLLGAIFAVAVLAFTHHSFNVRG